MYLEIRRFLCFLLIVKMEKYRFKKAHQKGKLFVRLENLFNFLFLGTYMFVAFQFTQYPLFLIEVFFFFQFQFQCSQVSSS
jgi:hypothetical protein